MTLEEIIAEAAQRYGVDPAVLTRKAQVESRMDPRAYNKSSKAAGLFQFVPGTAKDYGLRNPFDPYEAADAAARLTRDDQRALQKALGRPPTPAELYLAHQQGRGGAIALLSHPDAPAAAIVGTGAVTGNGGRTAMTAADFVNHVSRQFSGAKGGGGGHQYAGLPAGDRDAIAAAFEAADEEQKAEQEQAQQAEQAMAARRQQEAQAAQEAEQEQQAQAAQQAQAGQEQLAQAMQAAAQQQAAQAPHEGYDVPGGPAQTSAGKALARMFGVG